MRLAPRGTSVVAIATTALIALASLIYAAGFPLSADVGWHLYLAQKVSSGVGLSGSFFEVNSPLYTYLLTVPVNLADATRLGSVEAMQVITSGLAVLMAGWLAVLTLDRTSVGPALMACTALVVFLILPGMSFGQREHWMVMLLAPYVVVTWRHLSAMPVSPWTSRAAGVSGAIGLAIKPHFILVWLCVEAVRLWCGSSSRGADRRIPAHTLWALFGVAGWWLLVSFLDPEYLSNLVAAARLYGDFAERSRLMLAVQLPGIGLAGALVGVAVTSARRRSLPRLLLGAGIGAWLAVLIQGKGWDYHFYPVEAAVVATAVPVTIAFMRRARAARPSARRLGALLVCLMSATFMLHDTLSEAGAKKRSSIDLVQRRLAALRPMQGARSITVFSTSLSDGFPLVNYAGVDWASPFPSLWWLRVIYGTGDAVTTLPPPEATGETEKRYMHAAVERFIAAEPDVVFVDTYRASLFGGSSFPYIDYFRRDPAFRAAWTCYGRAGRVDHLMMYERDC